MSHAEDLLIIYETEAQQWATYLQSVFTGPLPEDGICCYDVATASNPRDDFLRLSRYGCKLLILSRGLLEGLCQLRRFFLSRVLSPAGRVVVLLCGVDSLAPLLSLVPLNADECLQVSSEQDAPDYVSSVVDIIRKGALATAGNANPLTCKPSGPEQKAKQMQSTGADGVRTNVAVVPSRVPCGSTAEVFVLLRHEAAAGDCEVEFSDGKRSVRVKPARWNELVLCVGAPDFPAGNVRLTVYGGGRSLTSTQLQYYTNMEELDRLLSSVADPVQFMCQALKVSSVDQLDQKLSSMLLEGIPAGGFQGLQSPNTRGTELQRADGPSLLHFAARYGLRCVSGLLLQCPGAERALRTPATRHGQTPAEVAKSHGHTELYALLTETLRTFSSGRDHVDASVYEMMCSAGANQQQQQQQGEEEEEEEEEEEDDDEDLYALLGQNDDDDDDDPSQSPRKAALLANRPPAPTPRPECMQAKQSKTPFIAQVFQKKKKTPKEAPEMYSSSSKPGHRREGSLTSTYDTFVPNHMERLMELRQRVKKGSLTVDEAVHHFRDWQQVQKAGGAKKEEELRPPRADIVNNKDDSIYDKIHNVRQTPTRTVKSPEPPGVTANQRGNRPAASEFYSKPLRGQQIFRKADKR
ncbi:B-cell scaffold protein with ankyrin repeats [Kryptolebias marmoratus]|uniref:B-cell scaffold protein with ankyrin repeats n=1 Tax=Kryptolebias marmoratus TaxID=37003 RepID=UPI000D530242|nr:B-cell scaffold protein with ankyrin repeats [Kryptolebias marmoratus]